jgi:hypothetical protein
MFGNPSKKELKKEIQNLKEILEGVRDQVRNLNAFKYTLEREFKEVQEDSQCVVKYLDLEKLKTPASIQMIRKLDTEDDD